MMPHESMKPDSSKLDAKIAPLVAQINALGIATYASCEGHEAPSIVQASIPYVVLCLGKTRKGAFQLVRFLGMLGIHNNSSETESVKWIVIPSGDGTLTIQPHDRHQPLDFYHRGVSELIRNLIRLEWYDLRKHA